MQDDVSFKAQANSCLRCRRHKGLQNPKLEGRTIYRHNAVVGCSSIKHHQITSRISSLLWKILKKKKEVILQLSVAQ